MTANIESILHLLKVSRTDAADYVRLSKSTMTGEERAIAELLLMTREELDLVDYDLKKWLCQVKGCCNGTKVRDYGAGSLLYLQRGGGSWADLYKYFWLCSKHRPFFERMVKLYGHERADYRMLTPFPPYNVHSGKLIDIKFKKPITVEKR